MEQVNWGIIGLGNIALKFSENLVKHKNSRLFAIASKDKSKLDRFQNQFSINSKKCFSNYEDLIDCKELDIIYIALPNALHFEWVKECINRKKNVLVEKPATLNYSQAKTINTLLEKKPVLFAEAMQYRYLPQTQKVINLLRDNTIGDLVSINSSFGSNLLSKKNIFGFEKEKKINIENRLFNKNLGGGAILDLGCYPVSFSILIAALQNADYEKIKINNKVVNKGAYEVDIDASLEIEFDTKFKAFISTSFKKDLGKKTEIIGKKGKITIEDTWHGGHSVTTLIEGVKKDLFINFEKNAYSYQIEAIEKMIIENKKVLDFPGMTIKDTLTNMKILDMWKNEHE